MNRLKLNYLKIVIETSEGEFGTDIPFKDGFNILRAKNTKGKSSTLNAILYALGIEEMLGGKNSKTMKPVLKDKLIFENKEVNVLESKVQLEITNDSGDVITLTRWIKSTSMDEKLIRVHFGAILSKKEAFNFKDYYVHLKGSASESAGFHAFLSTFVKWKLPNVPSFEGKDKLLYIQTLFPLFFVEQFKGWSGFYTSISGSYGIRDLPKRAFEFLLDMDITKNTKEREALKIFNALILNRWSSLKQNLESLADTVNGKVVGHSEKPNLIEELNLFVYDDNNKLIHIIDRIFQLEKDIKDKESYNIVSISNVSEKYEKEIIEQEDYVLQLQNELNSLRQDINLEKDNLRSMRENLRYLAIDLKRNQEAEKLYKLGSNIDSNIKNGTCPTCNQDISDTLLPPETLVEPLDLGENIVFIKEQKSTLEFGIKESERIIKTKQTKQAVLDQNIQNARKELRILKRELNENPALPTQKELEKLVELKISFNRLNEASQSFEKIEENFKDIKKDWKNYLTRKDALPEDYFSALDLKKLTFFEKQFLELLESFNYSSIENIDEITISKDKYTPIVSGFDIKFDSSASDNIRLIWSYIISIYRTSQRYNGNHPGFILFDEPGQQQMAADSQEQLFKSLSKFEGQSLVGTSLEPSEIKAMTKGLQVNIIDLGENYIIKPLL